MTGSVAGVSGLTLRYGKVTALDNVTLEIPEGRMVGLIGPDGVGKSSLLSLLAGARVIQQGKVEVLGGDRVEALRFERTQVTGGRAEGTGEFFEVDCGLVVAAIGYRSDPIVGAPYEGDRGIIPNDDGRVAEGLYTVGWIKRGPTGVISSNRYDGEVVADYIHKDFSILPKSDKAGRKGLESLFNARGIRYVTYADWKQLETMEIENATGVAPRRKFVTIEEMLEALDKSAPSREFA